MDKEKSMSIDEKVKQVFQKVLDVKPNEIEPNVKLDQSLDVDSTEMVEISVALKKELGVSLTDNELKKTHTFNEIVKILNAKAPTASGDGHSCGCGHKH